MIFKCELKIYKIFSMVHFEKKENNRKHRNGVERAKLLLQYVCVCLTVGRRYQAMLSGASSLESVDLANKQIINRFCFSVLIVFTKFLLPAAFRPPCFQVYSIFCYGHVRLFHQLHPTTKTNCIFVSFEIIMGCTESSLSERKNGSCWPTVDEGAENAMVSKKRQSVLTNRQQQRPKPEAEEQIMLTTSNLSNMQLPQIVVFSESTGKNDLQSDKNENTGNSSCIDDSENESASLDGLKKVRRSTMFKLNKLVEVEKHQEGHLGGGHRLDPCSSSSSSSDLEKHTRTILRRFPFPTMNNANRPSPGSSPRFGMKTVKCITWRRDTVPPDIRSADEARPQQLDPVIWHAQHALNYMVVKSVETAIPVVVPLEKWLQDRLSSWVQLSGHDGTIVPASDSTLWKKRASNESNESNAYIKLMNDPLSNFVAKFYLFIEIEDLTRHFNNPAIMDVKIGTRTFLESEVNNPAKRADLYKKMIAIDGNEPTEEEHADKAITKLRYMQFRERESSTAEFGFRIEAIKSSDGHTEKNFKRVKSKDEIMEILIHFFGPDSKKVRGIFVKRLKVLRRKLLRSAVFMTHEFIGSSLLFMYDKKHANVWMIDFAKVCPVETVTLNHTSSWQFGNHEDGYFVGLDNLIQIFEEMKLFEMRRLSANTTKKNSNSSSISRMSNSGFS
ncbi:Inositol-trisphosphate 3-kinase A [Trichinella nelsoni]|uniref:Kinase n=1 Tax=Trichinella nelsoni TaxID=6336 RepID=A0A0V0RSK7_9BILA|nr:Inositol-trisphosphate 3-kinase A [Trichinella nelsoni]